VEAVETQTIHRGERTGHTWWQEVLAPPVLAVQFLTAVPIPLAMPAHPRHLGRALACFPLVGAALGVALAGLDSVLGRVLPVPVSAALILVALTLLTGGLHLDGLMDACDGLFGGRSPERRLEIMRDSRVGAFGVMAGVLQLLLKYSVLAAVAPELRGQALVVALTGGRWAMAAATWAFPYARPSGLGAAFKAGVRWPAVAVATALALVVVWVALGPTGLLLLVVAVALAGLLGAYMKGKLGGLTGDCYGAIDEVVESGLLLVLLGAAGLAPAWPGGGRYA
jgi:adenosylcobinamide-GDP ribazoletransferase